MDIRIRKAGPEDTEVYISFLREVQNAMPNSDWFYIDPDEDVRDMMEAGEMEMWFAEDAGVTAGVFSIIYPGLEDFNLGNDLGFDRLQLERVVHMDTAAVRPDYRGQRLQYRLMMEAEKELARQGSRILLCTIHPENRYSLQNVLDQGYTIQKKKEKYGSIRYILRKDLA